MNPENSFLRGVASYQAHPPTCPKCGSKSEGPRYCVGLHGGVPEPQDPTAVWLVSSHKLQLGCTTRGEHLHWKCKTCGYEILTETKDATKNAIAALEKLTNDGMEGI